MKEGVHSVSCAFVQAAISNLRELACRCRAEISSTVDCIVASTNSEEGDPTQTSRTTDPSALYLPYLHFLQQLEDGARDIEVTFEGVGEYLQSTSIPLHLSLRKMKEQVQSVSTPAVSSLPDPSNSKEPSGATYNSVHFYEEALADLTNWLISAALLYATLPSADSTVAQLLANNPLYSSTTVKNSNKRGSSGSSKGNSSAITGTAIMPVSMSGVLHLHAQAEKRALNAIDSNLHARYSVFYCVEVSVKCLSQFLFSCRFASAMKAPRDFLAAQAIGSPTSTFSPDSAALYGILKSQRYQKEVAGVWFEQFCKSVTPYSGVSVSSGRGKRKYKTLDSSTLLKCRFANALHDLENGGILKCSRSSAQNPTVTIERKIYTWV